MHTRVTDFRLVLEHEGDTIAQVLSAPAWPPLHTAIVSEQQRSERTKPNCWIDGKNIARPGDATVWNACTDTSTLCVHVSR